MADSETKTYKALVTFTLPGTETEIAVDQEVDLTDEQVEALDAGTVELISADEDEGDDDAGDEGGEGVGIAA